LGDIISKVLITINVLVEDKINPSVELVSY